MDQICSIILLYIHILFKNILKIQDKTVKDLVQLIEIQVEEKCYIKSNMQLIITNWNILKRVCFKKISLCLFVESD